MTKDGVTAIVPCIKDMGTSVGPESAEVPPTPVGSGPQNGLTVVLNRTDDGPNSSARSWAMPRIRPTDPLPIKRPVCPTCGKTMRLESSWPDKSYTNLRHMMFRCGCGFRSDQLVAVAANVA